MALALPLAYGVYVAAATVTAGLGYLIWNRTSEAPGSENDSTLGGLSLARVLNGAVPPPQKPVTEELRNLFHSSAKKEDDDSIDSKDALKTLGARKTYRRGKETEPVLNSAQTLEAQLRAKFATFKDKQ